MPLFCCVWISEDTKWTLSGGFGFAVRMMHMNRILHVFTARLFCPENWHFWGNTGQRSTDRLWNNHICRTKLKTESSIFKHFNILRWKNRNGKLNKSLPISAGCIMLMNVQRHCACCFVGTAECGQCLQVQIKGSCCYTLHVAAKLSAKIVQVLFTYDKQTGKQIRV